MNSEEVTIISIAGKQNAGKTTLFRTLIPELKDTNKALDFIENIIKRNKVYKTNT